MLPDVLHRLVAGWRDQLRLAGIALRPPLSALWVGGDRERLERSTFLVFGADEAQPGLALKLARSTEARRRLAHEFQALREVWAIPALQSTVPRPIGLFQSGDDLVMLESCLPGATFSVLLQRRKRAGVEHVRHDLFLAQVWLQLLQTATALGALPFPGRVAVEQRLAWLRQAGLNGSTLPAGFADRLLQEAEDYRNLPLPLAGRHGDFEPDNLLLNGDRAGVIDWENFARGVTPFDDVFQFAVGLAAQQRAADGRWSTMRDTFCQAFVERNWFSDLVREYVTRYLRAMRLPEQAAHLFFSLFLIDRTVSRAMRRPALDHNQDVRATVLVAYAEGQKQSIFA